MRPCYDTFGLVRGNRRKAVFAFKGLFTEGHLFVFASGSGFLSRISELRGKSKLAEHTPIFANKTAGRKVSNLGFGRQASVFTALPNSPVDNMRQPQEPPGGAPGARPFWLNYSILNAHRAQFLMTFRTTFKWTSAD